MFSEQGQGKNKQMFVVNKDEVVNNGKFQFQLFSHLICTPDFQRKLIEI